MLPEKPVSQEGGWNFMEEQIFFLGQSSLNRECFDPYLGFIHGLSIAIREI
jgi:hypothetical protein